MHRVFSLSGGELHIETRTELIPLDELLGFAARANPKRPFLFVSKVMGRHVPSSPLRLRSVCRALAVELQGLPGPVWVVGMAETAIGLGGVLADTLARVEERADVVYHHTTRVTLAGRPLLEFSEPHSHAPGHLLYPPAPALHRSFMDAQTLILVDDEITTGTTISRLATRLAAQMPRVRHLRVVSLADWLERPARERIGQEIAAGVGRPLQTTWLHLVAGTFRFVPERGFTPRPLPAHTESTTLHAPLGRGDLGRRGVSVPCDGLRLAAPALSELPDGDGLAVIGAGECALPAFLFAEEAALRRDGVMLQCTTRSPILIGGAIADASACEDPDQGDVRYYLYNAPARAMPQVLVSERGAGSPDDAAESLAKLSPARFLPARPGVAAA